MQENIVDKDEVHRAAQGASYAFGNGRLYVWDLRHHSNPSCSKGAHTDMYCYMSHHRRMLER